MNVTLLLTREELCDLTGSHRRANITRWLIDSGWAHAMGLDGWPRVSRGYAKEVVPTKADRTQADKR